jgi:formylglycine-generating enzyme required for sulfatase activity
VEKQQPLKEIITKPLVEPEMVVIPAGSFRMGDVRGDDVQGDKDEVPVRTVTIQKPFAIGRYEVTFEEYDQFAMATNRKLTSDEGWGKGRQPAIYVKWDDAMKYAEWLSEKTGKRYRLPTEAEWEYAARAGTETIFWWGDQLKSGMANCKGCDTRWGGKQTSPVGSFPPNPFGLYDTAGNVGEWVEDCWHENYNNAPTDGSAWLEANGGHCLQRVIRGGSWNDTPRVLRASTRIYSGFTGLSNSLGFRLAQDVD